MFQGKRGLSLETLQHKRASSSVQGRISSFALSCGGKCRVPLELRVTWGTTRAYSGKSELLLRCEGHLGIPRA